jgi:hypothetical protein
VSPVKYEMGSYIAKDDILRVTFYVTINFHPEEYIMLYL